MRAHAETKTQAPSRTNATPVPNTLAHKAQLRSALRRAGVQPRLEVGAANDPLEREADATAERVLRIPEPQTAPPNLLQTKASATPSFPAQASSQVEAGLNSLNSGGSPLDTQSRAFFEPRFGEDFSQVRLHTNASATQMAASLNAKAFTLGNNIAFGANQYSAFTPTGRSLLGHELAHVIQQRSLNGGAPQAKWVQRRDGGLCSEESWEAVMGERQECLSAEDAWVSQNASEAQSSEASTLSEDQRYFESVIRAMEAEVPNVGTHLAIDSAARQAYAQQVGAMSKELRALAETGKLTWKQAAEQAQEARNFIMELSRNRSTPVGKAIAEALKLEGKTLNELIARYTQKLYGQGTDFTRLSPAQQNAVYAEIVDAAGRSNPKVTARMRHLSRAGKGLIVLSVAMSVYSIATAEDKVDATKREVAVTGAGILGGIAGGAAAGLLCGPGAPVCVGIGAFVGGALAAFGVDFFW